LFISLKKNKIFLLKNALIETFHGETPKKDQCERRINVGTKSK
jgi:hypothetical protein